jgi:hypothetical protein
MSSVIYAVIEHAGRLLDGLVDARWVMLRRDGLTKLAQQRADILWCPSSLELTTIRNDPGGFLAGAGPACKLPLGNRAGRILKACVRHLTGVSRTGQAACAIWHERGVLVALTPQ